MKEEKRFWELIEQKSFDDAEKIALSILENDKYISLGYYLLGHLLYAKEQIVHAVDKFKLSVKKDDNKVGGYSNYWLGYLHKNYMNEINPETPYDFKTSKDFFYKALNYTNYPENTLNQVYYEIISDKKDGLKIIESARNKFPDSVDVKFMELDYYYRIGDNSKIRKLSYDLINIDNSLTYSAVPLYLSSFSKNDYYENFELIDTVLSNIDDDDSLLNIIQYEYARILDISGKDKKRSEILFNKSCSKSIGTVKIYSFLNLANLLLRDESKFNEFDDLMLKLDIKKFEFYIDGPDFEYLDNTSINFYPSKYSGKSVLSLLKTASKRYNDLGKGIIQYVLGFVYYQKDELDKSLLALLKSYNLTQDNQIISSISSALSYSIEEKKIGYTNLIEIIKNVTLLIQQSEEFRTYFKNFIIDDFLDFTKERNNYNAYCNILQLYPDYEFDSSQLFNYAYVANQAGHVDLSFDLYSKYLDQFGETSAVLNNIANIYKSRGDLDTAESMFKRALVLDPNDEIVNRNLKQIENDKLQAVEKEKYDQSVRHIQKIAAENLKNENDYVLNKLRTFIGNWSTSPSFSDGKGPIPNFAFAKYMKADKVRANSLKQQFIEKEYLLNTEERDSYNARVYEINPYVMEILKEIDSSVKEEMDSSWENAFQAISLNTLKELNYFEILNKISKVNKKFSPLLERDFKSLVLNYLMKQDKAVIVLSGSLVELALVYYFERKKVSKIKFTNTYSGKEVNKSIYSANLIDMITFAYENNLFGTDFSHLSNLLRVYRNYIHPAVEIKQKAGNLDRGKAEVSFYGSIELLLRIIK